jgi:ribosomal protein L32
VSPRTVWKLLAAVIGAMSIAVVLLAVAVLTRSVDGLDSSLAALNWIVPIAAGFLVGGVAWALLATGDRLPSRTRIHCTSCGSSILEGWRICPHCGHFVGEVVECTERADSATA